MQFVTRYLDEVVQVAGRLDRGAIGRLVDLLVDVRERGGRLFVLGVGGSAGNASHAVNDFRKLVGLEAYTPTDNVSELTARINGDGWDTVYAEWLKGSRLTPRDCVLVFSLEKLEAFPIDVWVRRALGEWYFPGQKIPPDRVLLEWAHGHFGRYAGYSQQYLFHGRRLER